MENIIGQVRYIAYSSTRCFWDGWLASTAIIAGGKLWTNLMSPETKVSELLGYIGKPLFRRQLAVGMAVDSISNDLFFHLGNLLGIKGIRRKTYDFTKRIVSVSLGIGAAVTLTHSAYRILFYAVSLYSLFELTVYVQNK